MLKTSFFAVTSFLSVTNLDKTGVAAYNVWENEFAFDTTNGKRVQEIFNKIEKRDPEKAAAKNKKEQASKNRLRKVVLIASVGAAVLTVAIVASTIAATILGFVAGTVGIIAILTALIAGSSATTAQGSRAKTAHRGDR